MRLRNGTSSSAVQNIDEGILPLINIVFLLLIFFLVAGTIRPPEPFKVTPPKSVTEMLVPELDLIMLISADGALALEEAVGEQEVMSALQAIISENPARQIRILADESAEAVVVLRIMEDLRTQGAERVRLTTRPKVAP